jgi:3',5'-cyclic AMP phosphodiesterase CpdA
MPYLTGPGITRRELIAGVVSIPLMAAQRDETRLALLSDTHISQNRQDASRGFRIYENFARAVAEVLEAKPDAAIVCGDLARNEGLPGDYENLRAAAEPLSAKIPLAMALGNHDHRKNFLAAFAPKSPSPVTGRHVLVLERPQVRVVILDSLMGGTIVSGLLGKAQRAWLEKFVASGDDTPIVLFVHHTLDDGDNSLLDFERLLRIAGPARKVKAIFYGHSHAYKYDTADGLHLVNIPSAGYNFNDQEPVGWIDARFARGGASFTLRAFGGNLEHNGRSRSLTWRA